MLHSFIGKLLTAFKSVSRGAKTDFKTRLIILLSVVLLALLAYRLVVGHLDRQAIKDIDYRQNVLLPELEQWRMIWNAKHIHDYRIEVKNHGVGLTDCTSATLTIIDEEVAGITNTDGSWNCDVVYHSMTVNSLFEKAEYYLMIDDPARKVSIDLRYDRKYGYIEYLRVYVIDYLERSTPEASFIIEITSLSVLSTQ